MRRFLTAGLLGLAVFTPQSRAADDALAPVLKTAAGWDNYRFTVEEKPGAGTGGAVEGAYQKGKPLHCKADRIEFFKKGEALVYLDGGRWQRSKRGITSDPLRVLGGVAKVNTLRLPHEELAALAKIAGAATKEKAKDGGRTVYRVTLGKEAARQLARTEHRGVVQGGTARFWLSADGKLVKYSVSLRLQGRLGSADVNGTAVKTIALDKVGATKVEVPQEARKALE